MLGDLSVSKVIAMQAWEYLNSACGTTEKAGIVAYASDLSTEETRTGGSQMLTGQWTHANPGAPGSRETLELGGIMHASKEWNTQQYYPTSSDT